MSSTEVGLHTLRKWQRDKAALWLVSLAFADMAPTYDVWIKRVDPSRIDLVHRDSEDEFSLSIFGAKFREANPIEEPPPFEGMVGENFALFLFLELADGRVFVFGEKRPVC